MSRKPRSRGSSSPNDTRYPATAILLAVVVAALAGGAVLVADRMEASALTLQGIALFGLVFASLAMMSVKEADQWEKAIVLRFGTYRGLRGPGLFFFIPIVDRIAYHVDQRIRATDFSAESCLTLDTVPVNVDAIAFGQLPGLGIGADVEAKNHGPSRAGQADIGFVDAAHGPMDHPDFDFVVGHFVGGTDDRL